MSNGATNSAALAVDGRGNPRSSGYKRVVNDWYREPSWLVDALLDVEAFEGPILDPACGGGTIPARCLARGLPVIGTDIVDRGFGERQNFFVRTAPVDNIICNPPFNLAQRFVEHALTLVRRKVAVVQRLAFLEGQKRRTMFVRTPLARIWVSSRRASMPPGQLAQEGRGGAIAYAWFVWDHAHVGAPAIGWLP